MVVTIPTSLSVAESKRLMTELDSQGIAVSDVVINQYVGSEEGGTLLCLRASAIVVLPCARSRFAMPTTSCFSRSPG